MKNLPGIVFSIALQSAGFVVVGVYSNWGVAIGVVLSFWGYGLQMLTTPNKN